ncbi:MAG: type II secretion system protein [Candidatus Pacebacteria bacterium]|nr:type II secretion system protein [Candidatus Paceibacterota bacterium]
MTTKQRGFTLIEMIVSVAIFAIVMTAVAAAYLNLINIDRQTRGTNDVVNNLSFALDSMSRAIRTGTNYQCGGSGGSNCPSGSSEFTFINSSGQTVTYLLSNGEVGECIGTLCTPSSATYFTDPRIKISSLTFYVTGVGTGDVLQPRVTFVIHGTLTTSTSNAVAFTIQTTATERGIDI